MKKILFTLFLAVIASTGIAQTVEVKQKKQKKPFEVINASYISNYITLKDMNLQRLSYGASINIFNAHLDISVAPAAHRTSVMVGYWENESRILSINVGCRIKIVKGLGITPIIGFIRADIGDVNGWDWSVDNDGIVNEYTTKQTNKYFNYGAIADYTFFESSNHFGVKIGIVAQRYNFGAIIGTSFNW